MTTKQVSEFKEMAELIKDHFTPSKDNPIAYLGLEHIEQQTLRISSIGKSSDITSQKLKFKKNDILFGKLRPYFRKVVRPNFDGICSTDIFVVRAKKGISQSFLYYVMASNAFVNYSSQGTQGTKMPRASWDFLEKYEQFTPTLEKQERIGKILSDLDAKIQNLQNQNRILEQIIQTIFQSWFVDFDGVTEWDDSELGKIPKGWTVGIIGDFGEIITGKTPPTKNLEYYGQEYSFITIPDMHEQTWILKTERYLSEKSKTDFSKYFLPENSVLVSCIATVGLVSLNHNPALTNQQINSIVCSKNIPYTFVYCTMTRLTDQLITWASGGSATPNLNKGHFSSISVLIPHSKVSENFHNVTKNLFKKIQKNEYNIIHLTKTRDSLLPKLMSGEIRV